MDKNAVSKLSSTLPRIHVETEAMALDLRTGPVRLPVIPLPEKFIQWIDEGRKSMYQQLRGDHENVTFFSQHLPVLVTYNPDSVFPFNCGNKGVGFLPKPEYLEKYTNLYKETMEATRGVSWKESLDARLEVVSQFNFDHEAIDYRCLTSLEIFEKRSFNNLSQMPIASLHYTGHCPSYVSFQLNCGVEVVGQDDPRHTFIMLSRTMFEYDNFHIAQPQFPYAYIFWISEVIDKTPYRVEEQSDKVQYLMQAGELRWRGDAIAAINKAPGLIQEHIREEIEKYARERGFTEITLEFVHEAKKVLRG